MIPLLAIPVLICCKKPADDPVVNPAAAASNRVTLNLHDKAIIVVELDSTEIRQLTKRNGPAFYTVADNALYYDNMLKTKMDSLQFPILRSQKDTIVIQTRATNTTIVKDTTVIFSYYFYDGMKISKQQISDLLDI